VCPCSMYFSPRKPNLGVLMILEGGYRPVALRITSFLDCGGTSGEGHTDGRCSSSRSWNEPTWTDVEAVGYGSDAATTATGATTPSRHDAAPSSNWMMNGWEAGVRIVSRVMVF
jgi:hypothetical protein